MNIGINQNYIKRLSGKFKLNTPDMYITTKYMKIMKGKHIILLLSLRVLRALRGYIWLT
jgi:hypothetical protein